MDISKYADYFHDGGLYDIKQRNDKIELFMCSAEMDPEDLQDDIPLGQGDCITGILHLEGIRKITRNKHPFIGELKMEHQSGSILDFEIENNIVELGISWKNFRPKYQSKGFSTIVIEADKIYWENKPDLVDPYWYG